MASFLLASAITSGNLDYEYPELQLYAGLQNHLQNDEDHTYQELVAFHTNGTQTPRVASERTWSMDQITNEWKSFL